MKFSIHLPSAAAGVLACGILFMSMSQASQPPAEVWPPLRQAVVNVFRTPVPEIAIPPGGDAVILSVPSDRWLTITSNFARVVGCEWGELLDGTYTAKGVAEAIQTTEFGLEGQHNARSAGGPIGWTFRPGSSVVIRNVTNVSRSLYAHGLIGYYSRR